MHSHASPAGTDGVAVGPVLLVYDLANSETLAQAFGGAPVELELPAAALEEADRDAEAEIVAVG